MVNQPLDWIVPTETFGQRLRRLREARGLSQRKLGELAGLSDHSIYKAERGGNVRVENLLRLAETLGVSVLYLRDGVELLPEPDDWPALDAYLRVTSTLGEERIGLMQRFLQALEAEADWYAYRESVNRLGRDEAAFSDLDAARAARRIAEADPDPDYGG